MIELDDFEQYSAALAGQSVLPAGTVSALVAACHSKACAPPPIGTGGSTPTPSGTAGSVGSSASQFGLAINDEADKALEEFGPWIDTVDEFDGLTSSKRIVACKMRSERAVVDELLSSKEGRAAVDNLLGATFTNSTAETLNRIIDENAWTDRFSDDASDWIEHSRSDGATFGDLVKKVIVDANNLDDPEGLRDARYLLARMGMSATDATPERVAAHMASQMFIQNWAIESMSMGGSLQSQVAARDKYGLTGGEHLNKHAAALDGWPSFNDPMMASLSRAVLDAEHAATQRLIKETLAPNAKTVTLFRGTTGQYRETVPGDVVETELNPLSSWSASQDVAMDFAQGHNGITLKMEVPIEMIQSTPLTGRGCLDEAEFVVIGYPSQARRVL